MTAFSFIDWMFRLLLRWLEILTVSFGINIVSRTGDKLEVRSETLASWVNPISYQISFFRVSQDPHTLEHNKINQLFH